MHHNFFTPHHSISYKYNTSHWPGEKKRKMRFKKPYTRFVCGIIISNMLKALLYKCYVRRRLMGDGSKGHTATP